VAHACNPSYLGGRDQEVCGLKPAQANTSGHPISKIPNIKRAGGVAQGVCHEFKPQYHKKQKQKQQRISRFKYGDGLCFIIRIVSCKT
jgi:hypothetical protein